MTQRDQDWLSEALSAYVDGELSAGERAEVERRVRSDPEARALLTELQRTSALLSSLPRHGAPASVLEEIERHVERHALIGAPVGPVELPRNRGRWVMAISSLAAAIGVCVGGWWYLSLAGARSEPGPVAVRSLESTVPAAPSGSTEKVAAPKAEATRVAMRRLDSSEHKDSVGRAQPSPPPAPMGWAEGGRNRGDTAADGRVTAERAAPDSAALAGAGARANVIRLRVEVPDDAARDRLLAAVRSRSVPGAEVRSAEAELRMDVPQPLASGTATRDHRTTVGVTLDRDEFRGILQSIGGSSDERASVSLTRGDSRWEGLAAVDTAVEALFPARSAGATGTGGTPGHASAALPVAAPGAPRAAAVTKNAPAPAEGPTLSLISEFLRVVGAGPDVSERITEALDEAREARPGAAPGGAVALADKKEKGQGDDRGAPVGGDALDRVSTAGSPAMETEAEAQTPPTLGPEYGPAAPDEAITHQDRDAAEASGEGAPVADRYRSLVARALDRLNEAPNSAGDGEANKDVDATVVNDRMEIEIEVVVTDPRPHAPAVRPAETPKPVKPAGSPTEKR